MEITNTMVVILEMSPIHDSCRCRPCGGTVVVVSLVTFHNWTRAHAIRLVSIQREMSFLQYSTVPFNFGVLLLLLGIVWVQCKCENLVNVVDFPDCAGPTRRNCSISVGRGGGEAGSAGCNHGSLVCNRLPGSISTRGRGGCQHACVMFVLKCDFVGGGGGGGGVWISAGTCTARGRRRRLP